MKISSSTLDRRLAAYAAAGVALAAPAVSSTAQANVVYSGILALAVPQDVYGVYLDLVTGQTAAASFSGWDINAYGPGNLTFYKPASTTLVADTTTGPASALTLGAYIGPGDVFSTISISRGTNFYTVGTEYLGLQFNNTTTNATNYGWVQFQTGNTTTGFPATILGYAYENTGLGLAAGQTSGAGIVVPEPTTTAALGLGALALGAVSVRRMRRAVRA